MRFPVASLLRMRINGLKARGPMRRACLRHCQLHLWRLAELALSKTPVMIPRA